MIARRYARALLELSLKEGESENVKKEILSIGGMMRQKKYFNFFTDRMIHPKVKIEALASFSPLMRDFLRLVVTNKREEHLFLISRQYVELLNIRNNVIDCVVSSKAPLDGDQRTKLTKKLERRLGGKINMAFRTDNKMIGGIRINYGSKVIDGTVSGMLSDLLAKLTVN